ncbi:hypothetical protein [Bacillus cereus group sp. BfR-BA-01380]|uniref:hypothetical protein n=1 Tax=Bacillus cereus group sp. BfR-BA-01380 TaxID=2920324 RepID=UPI001F5A1695|nr:hypothetical protein [Bacillus cereus group sp. BfR-BA-01380]
MKDIYGNKVIVNPPNISQETMEKGQIIRDENGYVVKLIPTKKQLESFLATLIPATRELI